MQLNITDHGATQSPSSAALITRGVSLLRRSRFHGLGVTEKPEWIVAHTVIVFHYTSRWQSCHGKRQPEITTALQFTVESQW